MNLDVCPACRIQAPHRDGRTVCPRCGGPLVQTDARGAVAASVPRPAPAGPAPARPVPPARRPLRWAAHRPREAMPAPRPLRRRGPGPTPSYATVPRWGLVDAPRADDSDVDPLPLATDALVRAMRLTAVILGAAGVVHAIRYLVGVVNRTRPIPAWIDWLSGIAVFVFGLMALAAVVMALVAFGRWVRHVREHRYAAAGFVDPRRRMWVTLLAAVPLVNVVGAPLLLHEAATTGAGDPRADRVRVRLAVAWALVNALALVAIGYRIAAWSTSSLQVDADALALVTLVFGVSAVFARWAVRRIEIIAGIPDVDADRPVRRLVAA